MNDLREALLVMALVFEKELPATLITAYEHALSDLPLEHVLGAIDTAIRTCKFFPKPAELRELTPEGLTPPLTPRMRGELAWAATCSDNSAGYDEAYLKENALAWMCFKNLGGKSRWRMWSQDEEDHKRRHFVDLYAALFIQRTEDLRTGRLQQSTGPHLLGLSGEEK